MTRTQDREAAQAASDRRETIKRRKELKRIQKRMERRIPDEFVLAMMGELPVRRIGGMAGAWR